MGAVKKAAKPITKPITKAVRSTGRAIEKPFTSAYKEVARGGKTLVKSVVGAFSGGGGEAGEAALSDNELDLQRQQDEKEASQESELAKRKALLKRRSSGRGSLLSGSALGVQDTLG